MYLQDLISEALHSPESARSYDVSRKLAQFYPGRAIIEGNDCDFALESFIDAGKCRARAIEEVHSNRTVGWAYEVFDRLRNGWFEVDWDGQSLDVLLIHDPASCNTNFWILADADRAARAFFAAVCAFEPEHDDELLVFDGGCWSRNEPLKQEIARFRFEGLILPADLKAAIRNEAERFFRSKPLYDRYKAPWKRGLLLTGPPGNGKTHAIKALAGSVPAPCLYVRSFEAERQIEPTNMRIIFQKARRVAPCLLVFEDLDALVNDENRSYFLNEMDGFATNSGIFTVATTNHPEKLDPAILERPSRFDRVYHFGLPALPERLAYLASNQESLEPEARLAEDALGRVAAGTEGFSFATLKELMISSLVEWVGRDCLDPMELVVSDQIALLKVPRAGMSSGTPAEASSPEEACAEVR